MKTIILLSLLAIVTSCTVSNNQQKYPIVNTASSGNWELQHISTIPSDSSVYEVFYYTKGDSMMTYTAVNDTIILTTKHLKL